MIWRRVAPSWKGFADGMGFVNGMKVPKTGAFEPCPITVSSVTGVVIAGGSVALTGIIGSLLQVCAINSFMPAPPSINCTSSYSTASIAENTLPAKSSFDAQTASICAKKRHQCSTNAAVLPVWGSSSWRTPNQFPLPARRAGFLPSLLSDR